MQMHRELAAKLVAQMKSLHSKPYTVVPAREADFPHLDLGSYRQYLAALEALGYRYLGDVEILDVSQKADSLMARTMIRIMVSADGETCSGHYQVHAKMERLAMNLVTGLLNFRLFDAPAFFVGNLFPKQIYDFMSKVGLMHIVTSSAESAGKLSSPPSIDSKHVSSGTPLEAVRLAHVQRLATEKARTGAMPTHLASLDDTNALSERQRQLKYAHRAASGWITRDELIRFTKGNVALADSIFEEVQAVLHQT